MIIMFSVPVFWLAVFAQGQIKDIYWQVAGGGQIQQLCIFSNIFTQNLPEQSCKSQLSVLWP